MMKEYDIEVEYSVLEKFEVLAENEEAAMEIATREAGTHADTIRFILNKEAKIIN